MRTLHTTAETVNRQSGRLLRRGRPDPAFQSRAARYRWGDGPDLDRIRELHEAGRSLRFIAAEVQCSPATVLRALRGVSCRGTIQQSVQHSREAGAA